MEIPLIKEQAKELKKITGKTHCQCLDEIVKQMGFNSWNHFCAIHKEKKNENKNDRSLR